jgi:hypothetical protein
MGVSQKPRPITVQEDYCRLGEPPLSDKTAVPLLQSYRYQQHWAQTGQLYTAQNGIDDTYGDDIGTTENGNYIVILPGTTKADTTNVNRQLAGALIPWFCEPTIAAGDFTQLVTVTWQQSGGTTQTLYESAETIESGNPLNTKGFVLQTRKGTNTSFEYDPSGFGGTWSWGRIVTKGIHTAALGVWAAPDLWPTADQLRIEDERMLPGEAIRGHTSQPNDKGSLGTLIDRTGPDAPAFDAMFQNATRSVWQWGHALGVYTTTNSYQTMGGTGTEYKLYVPNLYPTSTIELYPTVYITTDGASGGDPAYFRITAEDLGGGADTWTLTLTSDTAALYDYTDASNDTLLCRVGSPTKFKIELMAPSSGSILMHTLAIWAKLEEV